jgi:hypothetical protein
MKMTSSKRFAVRTTLATGTTLATIMGAQALISLDQTALSTTPTAVIDPAPTGDTDLSVATILPAAPPNIVILRHAGQVTAAPTTAPSTSPRIGTTSPVAIQPPNPVQVAAPQPVPQQQSAPVVARTGSSR